MTSKLHSLKPTPPPAVCQQPYIPALSALKLEKVRLIPIPSCTDKNSTLATQSHISCSPSPEMMVASLYQARGAPGLLWLQRTVASPPGGIINGSVGVVPKSVKDTSFQCTPRPRGKKQQNKKLYSSLNIFLWQDWLASSQAKRTPTLRQNEVPTMAEDE